jgi:hypothetical protein
LDVRSFPEIPISSTVEIPANAIPSGLLFSCFFSDPPSLA